MLLTFSRCSNCGQFLFNTLRSYGTRTVIRTPQVVFPSEDDYEQSIRNRKIPAESPDSWGPWSTKFDKAAPNKISANPMIARKTVGGGTRKSKTYKRFRGLLGDNDTLVSKLTSLQTDKGSDKLVLEGKRLITDALLSGLKPELVVFANAEQLETLPLVEGETEMYQISESRMDIWSTVETAPGVIAVVDKPKFSTEDNHNLSLPLTAICDNIRDPTNMGSLLRSLAAAGCQRVLTTKGSCNVWESKVLRGGMGAHFRMPIESKVNWNSIHSFLPESYSVFLADSDSGLKSGTELPVVDYHKGNFSLNPHVVLVIGGETQGLSDLAYNFATKNNGNRLHIGMSGSMDSLNVAVSVGILAFEMKRQLLK